MSPGMSPGLNVTDAAREMKDSMIDPAFWSSMLMILGSFCGCFAMKICDDGRALDYASELSKAGMQNWRRVLRHVPSTLSDTIHLANSPHGSVFRTFFLLMAILVMCSEYPQYDDISHVVADHWRTFGTAIQVLRFVVPWASVLMVVFIPLSHDVIVMTERFRQNGYAVTREDQALYLKSKIQEDMHRVAAIALFAGTVGVETIAITVSLWHYFNSSSGEVLVSWEDKSLASLVWLSVTLTRCMTFLGVVVCGFGMGYHLHINTSKVKLNPDYSYNSEMIMVRELIVHLMLGGMSLWFEHTTLWNKKTWTSQVVLGVCAGLAILITWVWNLRVLVYVLFTDRYLDDAEMKRTAKRLLRDYTKRMEAVAGPECSELIRSTTWQAAERGEAAEAAPSSESESDSNEESRP